MIKKIPVVDTQRRRENAQSATPVSENGDAVSEDYVKVPEGIESLLHGVADGKIRRVRIC